MGHYRIILADDHVLLRQGVRRIIEESPDIEVVGETGNGLELLNLLKTTDADLVILDVSMPGLRGIEAVYEIKCLHAGVKTLILTMHRDREYVQQAFASGADGYVLKEDADTDLFSAIATIRRGGSYVSPSLAETTDEYGVPAGRGRTAAACRRYTLTIREKEVLKLIAEGRSSKDVAGLLYISVRTAEHHRANILRKLDIKNTADLVKYAINNGYSC